MSEERLCCCGNIILGEVCNRCGRTDCCDL